MTTFSSRKMEAVKEKQVASLITSLSSLRIAGKSDIILVCGEKEFHCHKLILEASSPYFETMFHSGLEEARSGRVVFNIVGSNILEAILDFIYLGEVDKIQTPAQLKDTLQVSHMMSLDNLFAYCCDSLLSTLTLETFCDIGEVAILYSRERMLEPLLDYMLTHRVDILASSNFLSMSSVLLKEYLKFSVSKQLCMNDMLGGLMKWLRADLPERKKFTKQLLQCIGVELVTQQFVATLLKDECLMQSAKEIANGLRSFSASILTWALERSQVAPAALNCGKTSIVFFSQLSVDAGGIKRKDPVDGWPTYVQQFDVQNMMWFPVQVIGANIAGAAFSQHKHHVYAVGGKLGSLVVMYNAQTRSVEYTSSSLFKETMNAGACFFDNGVYRSGGTEKDTLNIYYSSGSSFLRSTSQDAQIGNIRHPRSSPIFLTTNDRYLFVIGGNVDEEGLVIEFAYQNSNRSESINWEVRLVPNFPKMLFSHFFLARDTLQGFCFGNKTLIKLVFNKTTRRLETTHFPLMSPDKQSVTGVYQYPDPDSSMVFVSTVQVGPSIPNYLLEPETGKWMTLPLPTGSCSLAEHGFILKKTYVVEE